MMALKALSIEQTFQKHFKGCIKVTETKMNFSKKGSSISKLSESKISSEESYKYSNENDSQDGAKGSASHSSSIISDFAHLRPRGGLRGKAYWRDVIDEVEFAVHCVSQPRLPVIDYSLVLPPHLCERVKEIQAYDFSASDDVVYIRDEMREERPHDYKIASEDSRDEGQEGAPLVSK